MKIANLSYLENAPENELILGGASLGINSLASASGPPAYTLATTDTDLKTVGNGKVTIGKGTGTALAIGTDPIAYVSYDAQGFDKVIVKNRSGEEKNYAFDSVKVIAIDRPNK